MNRVLTIFTFAGVTFLQGWAEEPKAYSVNRYSLLWQIDAFKVAKPAKPTPPPTRANPTSDWGVAGIFFRDGKPGAILMNSKTKAIEKIDGNSESPSGIRLQRVIESAPGQLPKIEVIHNGQSLVLTGISAPASETGESTSRLQKLARPGAQ